MHRTLTWTTGSLSFCKRIHMRETSVYSLIRRTFVRICAEFDFGEVSWRAQSLTRDGGPSRWRPRSIALHSPFESGCSATGSPVLQLVAVVLLLLGVTTQVCCNYASLLVFLTIPFTASVTSPSSPHLHTPFSPSLMSLMVSVDVKHHVYLIRQAGGVTHLEI